MHQEWCDYIKQRDEVIFAEEPMIKNSYMFYFNNNSKCMIFAFTEHTLPPFKTSRY